MLKAIFRNAARALRGNMSTQTFKGHYDLRIFDECYDRRLTEKDYLYTKHIDHFVWAEAEKLGDDRYSIKIHVDQEGSLPEIMWGRHFTESAFLKADGRQIFSKAEATQFLQELEERFQKNGIDGRALTPVRSPVDYLHFKNATPQKMKP